MSRTPERGAYERVEEEALARDATTGVGTGSGLAVQGVEQRRRNKVRGPDHTRGSDEETLADTAKGEAWSSVSGGHSHTELARAYR